MTYALHVPEREIEEEKLLKNVLQIWNMRFR